MPFVGRHHPANRPAVPTRRAPRPGRTRHASVATSPPPRRTGAANPLARPATPVSPPWHLLRAPRRLRRRRTCDSRPAGTDRPLHRLRCRLVDPVGPPSAAATIAGHPPSGTVPRVPVGVRSPVRGTLCTTHHPRSRGIFEVTGLSTELPSQSPGSLAALSTVRRTRCAQFRTRPDTSDATADVDARVRTGLNGAAHDGHHDHHHHSLAHAATGRRAHRSRPRGGSFISRHEHERDERRVEQMSDSDDVEVFDTTLRDGLQVEGVSATVEDKLRIAEQLDHLGVHFIEGGWPGANPKDIEFFARAATELQLTHARRWSPSARTRRPRGKVDDDPTLRNLLDAGTAAVCIVAKSSDYHVLEALQTTLDEGEAMIADSVEFLAGARPPGAGRHGALLRRLQAQPRVLAAGARGGGRQGRQRTSCCATPTAARCPTRSSEIVGDVHRHVGDDVIIGIHCHDDTGCAVANSMAAVRAGARHVQGTLNGLGERTGNANLTTIIPNLQLKLGLRVPARRSHRAAHRRSATTSPRCSTGRSTRRRRTSARRRSPTRPACTSARSSGPRTPTSTSTRSWSATAPASSSARWPGGRRSR